jgi:hypothetical protein
LEVLDLSGNAVSGSVDPVLGGVGLAPPDLVEVRLGGTLVSGELPQGVEELGQLRVLDVSNTFLSGPLPDDWTGLSRLQMLSVRGSMFEGPVPETVCAATALQEFRADGNRQINGSLPACLTAMPALRVLDLRGTGVAGDVPDPGGSPLQELRLARTQVSGSLSPAWLALPSLRVLDLDFANVGWDTSNGTLVAPLAPLEEVHVAQTTAELARAVLDRIALTGAAPRGSLRILDASENGVTSPFPGQVASLTQLVQLDLSGNNIGGVVPQSVEGLVHLEVLDLERNFL